MSKLITKARSGVTLVELLVVILIVTILSVSMLPLLQPFVVEAQYAAEPIPVIGSIRTKIGMYQYDKGRLPCIGMTKVSVNKGTAEDPDIKQIDTPQIESWVPVQNANSTSALTGDNAANADLFRMAFAALPDAAPPVSSWSVAGAKIDATDADSETYDASSHLGTLCDIDYQELKGKRSKPCHYQYLVLQNGTDYAYFLGCFGDGNGLKAGTGYAVCEIVSTKTGHKYVGTWKRYKAINNGDAQICFTTSTSKPPDDTDLKHTYGCYVPDSTTVSTATDSNGQLRFIGTMETYGWEF